MKIARIVGIVGVLFLSGLLFGCAQLPTGLEGNDEDYSGKWVALGTDQDQGQPDGCVENLSKREAKKEARESLQEEEVQELKDALSSLGKRLKLNKAQGCKVEVSDSSSESDSSSQPQWAALSSSDGTDGVLLEIPAGKDAALYVLELGEDMAAWASIKEAEAGGERLVHMELGLEEDSDAAALSSDDSSSVSSWELFLPDEQGIQEIVGQVQQMLVTDSGSAPQAKALGSDLDVDWSAAEVIIDEAVGEALLVLPPSSNAQSQALWGSGGSSFNDSPSVFVKVSIRSEPNAARPVWKVEPVAPKMRRGQEYDSPFELCPYRWYGKLSAFRRPLCQGYWEKWHRKQWDKKGIEVLASLYNATVKAQGPSTLYFPYKEGKALLIHGKEQISKDLIQKLITLSETLSAEGILQSPANQELLAILMAEAQAMPFWVELKKAIELLALFIYDPITYEKVLEDLKKNDPAFKQFWDVLIKVLGDEQKSREMVDTLAWLASKPDVWESFTQAIEKAIIGLETLGFPEGTIPVEALGGLANVFRTLAGRSAWEAISFGWLFADTINLILSCRDCSDAEKQNLILGLLEKAIFTWGLTAAKRNLWRYVYGMISVDEFVFDVKVIEAFLRGGWRPIAIDFNVGGSRCALGICVSGDVYVDLIARMYSPELGRTITAYISAYDKFDPDRITRDMRQISEYIKEQKIPDGVAVAVIGEKTSHEAIKEMADKTYTSGVPVVHIYEGPDGEWYWYCNCQTEEEYNLAAATAAKSPYKPKPSPLMSGCCGSTGSDGDTDSGDSSNSGNVFTPPDDSGGCAHPPCPMSVPLFPRVP